MRILTIICLSLIAMTCFAAGPEYFSSRQWIEKHTPKDKTPKEQRVFVGDAKQTTNTYILCYQDGISLRDVINATHLKGTEVMVTVLRSEHKTEPVFFGTVKGTDKPKFQLQAQDVIWLSTLPWIIN
jgi:hypothetical protein